ncbi:MOSC domain-containing protein [Nonomuraea sp. NN258]|nr:MOSC domain-containing protein [Nonomuraea antri]
MASVETPTTSPPENDRTSSPLPKGSPIAPVSEKHPTEPTTGENLTEPTSAGNPAVPTSAGNLAIPAFGENLTISGILESDAVLGSVYAVGTAVLQVSQPRRPCYKLAAHHDIADMAVLTQRSGRTGFYFRVLRPGQVAAGDRIDLIFRPRHGITAAETHRVLNVDRTDLDAARHLLAHPEAIPASWAALLRKRLDGLLDNQTERLYGDHRSATS